jgi:hypothetical protein
MIGLDVIFGGVTGLLGTVIGQIFKYKTAKIENEHERGMLQLETQAMIQEAEMQIQVTKSRVEGEIELAELSSYEESIRSGQKSMFGKGWLDKMFVIPGKMGAVAKFFAVFIAIAFAGVDILRSLMRPVLTIYTMAAASYLTYLAWTIMKATGLDSMTLIQAISLYTQVTDAIIYLAISAFTWWFGDRMTSKFLQQRDEAKQTQAGAKKPDSGGPDVF